MCWIGYTFAPRLLGPRLCARKWRVPWIDLAFTELNLHKIELSCLGVHVQSQRVAENLALPL